MLCVLLPLLVNWLYSVGEATPMIISYYNASDILSYIATTIGVIISMAAFFLSLNANEIDFDIKHAHTISEQNNDAIYIELSNNNNYECHVLSVEVCNLKDRVFSHIVSTPPFSIPAKGNVAFTVETDKIKKILSAVKKKRKDKDVKYCVRLSIGKNIYLKADELFKYLSI